MKWTFFSNTFELSLKLDGDNARVCSHAFRTKSQNFRTKFFLFPKKQIAQTDKSSKNLFDKTFFRTKSKTLCSIFDVSPDVFEFGKNLGEESGLGVDPEHGVAQLVDDVHAPVPEPVLVCLHQKGLQRIADFVAHVTEKLQQN